MENITLAKLIDHLPDKLLAFASLPQGLLLGEIQPQRAPVRAHVALCSVPGLENRVQAIDQHLLAPWSGCPWEALHLNDCTWEFCFLVCSPPGNHAMPSWHQRDRRGRKRKHVFLDDPVQVTLFWDSLCTHQTCNDPCPTYLQGQGCANTVKRAGGSGEKWGTRCRQGSFIIWGVKIQQVKGQWGSEREATW